ncbi:class I adenylate-forming enzyme family protein [Rhodococcus coprophilus]|uniref:Fatty-acid--CoA ligase n=1 Tax=Rhodococcus coprophilus TaxID=38310 RepID=A0A2X4U5B4_9NOCA|nr:class I adenylate-forming enzyme family protein [Rhodococcus coprophilus]MBM7459193.1 acyl-CoA synthetase (AMP-forming)/AMP-acid ligase II [Rhodococcus coprophilus]SQI35047.1 fatty-acid--CoA ligase [Rhodococcus coprophilus]
MTEPAVLAFEDREFTLADLDSCADGIAHRLRAHDVGIGDRVALMSSNRPEFVAAVQAVWRLGAVVVLMSPSWKRTEVDHAFGLTAPVAAVGDSPVLAEAVAGQDVPVPMLHLDELHPGESGSTDVPSGFTFPRVDRESDAVLVFSSGTTGLPKAVRHTHASFGAAVAHWRDALALTPADRIQIVTPPSHILGLLNIATALEAGAWMRLHHRFDLETMLRHIERDRITVEMAVAPIAMAIASYPGLESLDLSSLRYIMWGATPVTPSIAETVTRRTGVPWVPAYGASEIPVIACNPIDGGRLDSVGRAVPGVELRVVSLDTGEPVSPGERGEIQVKSRSLMAGYLPADATADAFTDGWYRTGDVGSVDEAGWIRITDRSKEMIKVNGFQVAPAEVEAVLHGHPAVADCAVFGVADEAAGEAVVAAVTPCAGATIDSGEIIGYVAERLASYKRPSRVVLVPEIPRLPSGKVLRRLLEERHGRTSDE